MDCSLLPLMPLPSADIKPSEELEAEVRRVEELLKAIRDSWKVFSPSAFWITNDLSLLLIGPRKGTGCRPTTQ